MLIVVLTGNLSFFGSISRVSGSSLAPARFGASRL